MHLNPTQVAIRVFGSPTLLTKAIEAQKTAPFKWLERRISRGEAGDIPVVQIRKILNAARERGLELTERDLLYGREVPDPEPATAAV